MTRRCHAGTPRSGRPGDGYQWIDLGSSNGSFVNHVRVQQQALRSGDRVQIGRTLMILHRYGRCSTAHPGSTVKSTSCRLPPPSSRHGSSGRSARKKAASLLAGVESSDSPWLARARSNLQIMYRTALAVSHTLDIDQLLQRIMELIFEWVEADRGCIMLVDRDTDQLVPKVRRDRHSGPAAERMIISRTILDYVREHNEGVLTSDAREDDRWDPAASILQAGRPRGDLRADARPLRRGGRDLHRHVYLSRTAAAADARQSSSPMNT